jgi:tellurite resistance protein TerC
LLTILQNIPKDDILMVVFGALVFISLFLDLVILQRNQKEISVKSALIQSACWVTLALSFGGLIWFYQGKELAVQYVSAYLMEYSLSVDNIFVFVLILSYFKIIIKYYHKVLFYGIIGAIIFRVLFIMIGIVIVAKFHWVLYFFGLLLLYTGYKILSSGGDQQVDPENNVVYKFMKKYFRIVPEQGDGSFSMIREGKKYYSLIFLVVGVIASTDLVFAVDSIPAVFAISQNKMVVLSSNIFAVLGLRAMFFMLMGAVNKFRYLQQGISFVLMFIGVKMLIEIINWHIPTEISLLAILAILSVAVTLSLRKKE